jgi:CheY-like chemotaxis protein
VSTRDGTGRDEGEIEEIRDEVISAVAHKLRTPLAIITGYAELLIARDDEETRRVAPLRIKEAADHLLAVVDGSLAALDGEGARSKPRDAPQRIMIVDDDDAVRNLLRLTLPAESFEIVEACDGDEALRLAAEIDADLVLLDWRMPNRSGAEVLAALRGRQKRVPVIVLTADGERAHKEARSLGADAFLTKPFSPLQLLDTVERLLS